MKRLVVACLLTTVLGACGVSADGKFSRIESKDIPFALAATTTTTVLEPTTTVPATSTLATESVSLYYVVDDGLVAVPETLPVPVTLEEVMAALSAQSRAEAGPKGARTILRTGLLSKVTARAGVANVDLTADLGALTVPEQRLAVAQIVLTLTARAGIGQVTFTLNGESTTVPRGDGSVAPGPVSRDDYVALVHK